MSFEPGDVVTLKSGGIKMTVEEIDGNDVSCVWQDKGRTFREEFTTVLLKKWEPPSLGVMVV